MTEGGMNNQGAGDDGGHGTCALGANNAATLLGELARIHLADRRADRQDAGG